MRNYYEVTDNILISLKNSKSYSKEILLEFISYGEFSKRWILENVSKGGSNDDYRSQASFISFMSMVNHHLSQLGIQKYLHLTRKSTDECYEYSQKFLKKLSGG